MNSILSSREWTWVSGKPIRTPIMMARRFRFLCYMFEMMFLFGFRGVTGTGYWGGFEYHWILSMFYD